MSDEIKITPIKKILDTSEFTDGDIVKKVRGKITKLYEVKKGGDYEYQNGEFVGEDGGTIRICFSKCSQPESAKNKMVTIVGHKSEQHGWTGIKVYDKEYDKDGQKKIRRELRVSATATLTYDGGAPSGNAPSNSGGSQKTGQNQSSGSGGGNSSRNVNNDIHPKIILGDLIALHADIVALVNETYGVENAKPEFIATIFIEAGKQGLAFNYKDRASKPVPVKYPPAPSDPSEWKECVMPWGETTKGKKLSEITDETLKKIHKYFDDKADNSALAECVYQAARDRDIFKAEREEAARLAAKEASQQADDAALDAEPDDIPF